MIASLGSENDFAVYLVEGEVARLGTQYIVGRFVRIPKAKRQGDLILSIDDSRSKGRSDIFGVGVEQRGFSYDLFIATDFYHDLVQSGRVGLRYGFDGSKVDIMDIERADDSDRALAEALQFYVEHKNELPSVFD